MPTENPPAATASPERTRRAMCARCERPVTVCYCAALTTLETQSRIVILQHPREHRMPIGTAHMACLCLPQASLHVGLDWDDTTVLRDACSDPARPPVLLYPGPGARDILRAPPPAPVTLIMVDGTWSQARTLVRRNPRLAALPRFAFEAPEPTVYRIRKEPRVEYVSTLEALVHVLGALEGDPSRFRELLRPMNAMVEAQLAAQARAGRPRKFRPRRRPPAHERLPRAIFDRYEDLVLVFGDANAWPRDSEHRRLGQELVHWVAHRPSTGATLERILAPRIPLSPDTPRHTGLAADELLAGSSLPDLFDAFSGFTRPTDVVASWGFHGLRLFKASGGVLPGEYVDLRAAARALTNVKNGTLEQYAAATVGQSIPAIGAGRAGRRLGMLHGILDVWRALPRASGQAT